MNRILKLPVLILISSCFAFTPFHHGWSDYNQEKTLDYTGVIQESKYENPHATIKIKDKKKVWFVYLAPVSRMQARGMNADMVKKGNTLRVVGYPHRKNKNEMRAERVFVGETKFELR